MKKTVCILISVLILIASLPVVSFSVDITGNDLTAKILAAWENGSTYIDVSSYGYTRSTMDELTLYYYTVQYSYPEYFYVDASCSIDYEDDNIVGIRVNYLDYTEDDIDVFNAKIAEIISFLSTDMSDFDIALFLHDYIVDNTSYDSSGTTYSAYDCLVNGYCVCEGYARAYMLLLNKLGINCVIVTSDEINHMWNAVEINGNYYFVDVTWDDTASNHNNFLVSQEKLIANGHTTTLKDWQLMRSTQYDYSWNDTTYDNLAFSDCGTEIQYYQGYWYYTDDVNVYAYDSLTNTSTRVTNNTTGFRSVTFAIIGERIYYNLSSELRSCALDGSDDTLEYSLTSSELSNGFVYRISYSGHVLTYYISRSKLGEVKLTGELIVSDSEDHIFSEWEILTQADCENYGSMSRTCSECGYVETSVISPTGHTYVETVLTAATCTEDGLSSYVCSVCGDSYTVTTSAFGHVESDWIVDIAATEDTKGYRHSVCTVCGEILSSEEYYYDDEGEKTYICVTADADGLTLPELLAKLAKVGVTGTTDSDTVATGMILYDGDNSYVIVVFGDVNRDGNITLADARLILCYAIGIQETGSKAVALAADVEYDSVVDLSDARKALRVSIGLE